MKHNGLLSKIYLAVVIAVFVAGVTTAIILYDKEEAEKNIVVTTEAEQTIEAEPDQVEETIIIADNVFIEE